MNSLFDRLIEDGSSSSQPIDQLAFIGRDIENLLNHPRESLGCLNDPFLEESILNYGLPSFVGKSTEASTLVDIEHQITRALCRFEPRLHADSIVVRRSADVSFGSGIIIFDVEARLSGRNKDIKLHLNFDVNYGRTKVVTDWGA